MSNGLAGWPNSTTMTPEEVDEFRKQWEAMDDGRRTLEPLRERPLMQTRLGSVIETVASTCIGLLVSVVISHYIYPLYGFKPSIAVNFEITAIFTVASIIRGYATRRFFNYLQSIGYGFGHLRNRQHKV